MACLSPLKAYYGRGKTESGKNIITFDSTKSRLHGLSSNKPFNLPCGKCIGCRLDYSRQWAIRCVHEALMHEHNCFLTLTYSNEELPKNGWLKKEHFQLFMKRLRKRFPNDKIRYFHCGEYGGRTDRPHYHALLFGFNLPDRQYHKHNNGNALYTSDILDATWGHGYCWIGDVTFNSCAYVARYITKKLSYGQTEESQRRYIEKYQCDPETGELKPEEYVTMSRRKGIGATFLERYSSDIYPHDYVVMQNFKTKPPRYYDSIYDIENPEEFAKIKEARKTKAKNDLTEEQERLKNKSIKINLEARMKLFKQRSLENG